MGRCAYDRSRQARDLFQRADEVLQVSLSTLCFEGPPEALLATRWQQPAILTCGLAILAAFEELYPTDPATRETVVAAGHSLGEYSALVYAGALSFDDGVRLAHIRGELMQEAADRQPGGMTAVLGLSVEELSDLCARATEESGPREIVVVANRNSVAQTVLSGTRRALARATDLARAHGARRTIPLAVGGAFHSPLMATAACELTRVLKEIAIETPRLPVLANTTGRPISTAAEIRAELACQVTAPVLWAETVIRAAAMGATRCVETGPGETLLGLVRRTVPSMETMGVEKKLA